MALTKQDKIKMISNKYNIFFSDKTKELILDDILKNNYHSLEVQNLAQGREVGKFQRFDLGRATIQDLRNFVEKYKKVKLPSELKREIVIDILLGKISADKLSDKDLKQIGKSARSTLMDSLNMYGKLLPKVGKFIDKRDIKRGKKVADRY